MTATHQMYQPLLLIWRFDPLNELCADFGLDDWSLLSTPGIRRLIARVVDLAVATSPSAERLGVS
jgi:hypothetical protein